MKTKLLFLLFLASLSSFAQYTPIPDVNFEQKLIDLGIDTDGINGKVLTSNINTLTSLYVDKSSIQDLTGIQDFVDLETLNCNGNSLTALDLSSNTKLTSLNANSNKLTNLNIDNNIALINLRCGNNLLTSLNVSNNTLLLYLVCNNNQITSLNVSKNIVLEWLMFHYNKVKTIDISNNPELTYFDCLFNELTSIDISNNPKIFEVACENNQLTYLNLKNGNNVNFDLFYSNFNNNPNLTCIQVDDNVYSDANWSYMKDATATYSLSCPSLGIAETVFDKIAVYPNPAKGELHIDNSTLEKATIYDALGKLITTTKFSNSSNNNTINLAGFRSGIYYIYLENQGVTIVKKIIIE